MDVSYCASCVLPFEVICFKDVFWVWAYRHPLSIVFGLFANPPIIGLLVKPYCRLKCYVSTCSHISDVLINTFFFIRLGLVSFIRLATDIFFNTFQGGDISKGCSVNCVNAIKKEKEKTYKNIYTRVNKVLVICTIHSHIDSLCSMNALKEVQGIAALTKVSHRVSKETITFSCQTN